MRSSRAAVDQIVSFEVGSKALYEKKYQRPEWPGVQSGITVGIGYDLGYNTKEDIKRDWSPHLPPEVVARMMMFAGYTRQQAKELLPKARQGIVVPWDAAMAVFMSVSLPKFEKMVLRACPGSEKLPAGCFGVLAGLTYNRGPAGFTSTGDRYREMRNIRAHVATGEWDRVSQDLRDMKRIWPNVPGLQRRREEEAMLWDASLKAAPPVNEDEVPGRVDTGDHREPIDVTPEVTDEDPDPPLNVQPSRGKYSLDVELIQKALTSMGYYEVGAIDGKFGGKFVAGVAAFMTDRGKDPNKGRITPDLKAEIAKAKAEILPSGKPWTRPIAPSRANATAKDIAPTVASVNATWYTKLGAWILGLPAGIGAGLKGLFGEDTTGGYIQKIKDIFAAVPTELYLVAVFLLAVAIYIAAKKAQDATVKDYQQGKIN
jgi:hypothetical protein